MFHTILLARLIKFVGVSLLVSGAMGGMLASDPRDRRRAAHLIASPGFLLTWGAGFVLMRSLGHSPMRPWIVGAALCSIVAMNALHWSVAREQRPRHITGPLICIALIAALCLMIWRPS
jgi:hypothetical protein